MTPSILLLGQIIIVTTVLLTHVFVYIAFRRTWAQLEAIHARLGLKKGKS